MARKKQPKKYRFNEHDENQVLAIREKRKKQKKQKKLKRIRILLGIIIVVAFILSPFSRVKSVTVKGNELVDKNTILKASKVDTTNFYFVEWFRSGRIEERIEAVDMVQEADVHTSIIGHTTITVKETETIAWGKVKKKNYLIGLDGGVVESTKSDQELLGLTQVSKFNDLEMFREFAKEYAQLPVLVRNDVSDVVYSPKECDETRLEMKLNDGKIIYIRIEELVKRLNEKDYDAYMQTYGDRKIFSFEGDSLYMSMGQSSTSEESSQDAPESTTQTAPSTTEQNNN